MHLVRGLPDVVRAMVAAMIPRCAERGFLPGSYAIGVANERNEIVGGFVYHDYDPESGVLEISGASCDKRWLTRETLYGLFAHPSNELNCQMVAMRHSPEDKALARMLKAYGFKTIIIPRLLGRNHDALLSTLTVEDWRANGFHRENKNG